MRSEETAKRTMIDWQMRRLATSANAGYGTSVQPLSALFDQSALPADQRTPRPAMVFVSHQEPDAKAEKRMFDDNDIGIAARYFDCARLFVEDFESKADVERYAKRLPTIIFLDASAKEVGRLSGPQITQGDVFRMMGKTTAAHFKRPLSELVAKYEEFLKRFDKVEGKLTMVREELKAQEEHFAVHPCDRSKNAIKECNSEIVTLDKDRAKLSEEEKKLLEVAFKTDPYAVSEAKETAKK